MITFKNIYENEIIDESTDTNPVEKLKTILKALGYTSEIDVKTHTISFTSKVYKHKGSNDANINNPLYLYMNIEKIKDKGKKISIEHMFKVGFSQIDDIDMASKNGKENYNICADKIIKLNDKISEILSCYNEIIAMGSKMPYKRIYID